MLVAYPGLPLRPGLPRPKKDAVPSIPPSRLDRELDSLPCVGPPGMNACEPKKDFILKDGDLEDKILEIVTPLEGALKVGDREVPGHHLFETLYPLGAQLKEICAGVLVDGGGDLFLACLHEELGNEPALDNLKLKCHGVSFCGGRGGSAKIRELVL